MVGSAERLERPVLDAILKARSIRGGRYEAYKVVVTGRSLGAGTSCLLGMLLNQNSGITLTVFAFAPPPVITRTTHGEVASGMLPGCTIHSFIHNADMIPRSSHYELVNLLAAVRCIDMLPWGQKDRSSTLLQGKLSSKQSAEIQEALSIRQAAAEALHKQNKSVELVVPGNMYWLIPVDSSAKCAVEEGADNTTDSVPSSTVSSYKLVHMKRDEDLFSGMYLTGDSMISDHSVSSYMDAIIRVDTSQMLFR